MRHWLAPLLCVIMALPALAEVRPKARPAGVAFAAASDLAPRQSPRPLRSPAAPAEAPVLRITMVPKDLARWLAQEPVGSPVAARGMVVTMSAANAPMLPDVAATLRTAFVAVPGPALLPRARPGMPQVTPVALVIAPRLRPAARPALAAPSVEPEVLQALAVPRPQKRPADLAPRAAKPAPEAEAVIVRAAAVRVNPGEQLVKPKKGSVCGDRRIRGETLPPITAKVKGCGIAEPVRVNEVDGVRLSPAATMDCTTARALKSWVEGGLKPAAGKRGVAQLNVAAHYACRSRNNIKGARISEHGRGKAIDIASVVLGNGQVIDVLRDYRRDAGKLLRTAHKAACGVFGTTLGPGSDGYHENHLHFDTASYRSGPYCR